MSYCYSSCLDFTWSGDSEDIKRWSGMYSRRFHGCPIEDSGPSGFGSSFLVAGLICYHTFFVRLSKLNVAYKFVYHCYYHSPRYVPPCRGELVEPFKHFLHARAHLWFLVLELQVLVGTHLLIQPLLASLL